MKQLHTGIFQILCVINDGNYFLIIKQNHTKLENLICQLHTGIPTKSYIGTVAIDLSDLKQDRSLV